MIYIPLVVSWIMIVIQEIICYNYYTCMCIHFSYVSLCTINVLVHDKQWIFSDACIHPFIHLPLASYFSVYILIIILTYM